MVTVPIWADAGTAAAAAMAARASEKSERFTLNPPCIDSGAGGARPPPQLVRQYRLAGTEVSRRASRRPKALLGDETRPRHADGSPPTAGKGWPADRTSAARVLPIL